MTTRQIEIGDKILKIFGDKGGDYNDNRLFNDMFNLGYPRDETRNIYVMLIEDFKLLRRNIGNRKVKHLTDKGYDASKLGLKSYLKKTRRADFINGYSFKFIQFIIPTTIAIIALISGFKNKRLEDTYQNYYTTDQLDSIINELKVNQIKSNVNFDTLPFAQIDNSKIDSITVKKKKESHK